MFRADNSFSVLIGKSVSRTASVQITDPSTSSTYIASGEILVLGSNDVPLVSGQTITDSSSIRIVQGDGSTNPLVFTPRITGVNVTAFSDSIYVAPQEQVYYIGYNGSAGSINLLNSNRYIVRMPFKHDAELWSEQVNINQTEYTSTSNDSQQGVAAGFALGYSRKYPSSNADVKVERVCDGTFTAALNATTATVANGSTTVTMSASNHGFTAGNIIRIGGTLSTTPVYIVASVSGASVILDTPYMGASGAVTNANIGAITVNTVWGLKYTGIALTFNTGRFKYLKVAFDLTISGWGTTTITKTQEANRGKGTYEEVAELEYFSLGFEGWLETRNSIPYTPQPRINATSGTLYNCINIKAYDETGLSVVSGVNRSPFSVFIFLPVGASQTTNIKAQLNPWMASLPLSFSPITIV